MLKIPRNRWRIDEWRGLVLPLLRSANKFIVWHVNGCVRAKKLQRSVKKILNEPTEWWRSLIGSALQLAKRYLVYSSTLAHFFDYGLFTSNTSRLRAPAPRTPTFVQEIFYRTFNYFFLPNDVGGYWNRRHLSVDVTFVSLFAEVHFCLILIKGNAELNRTPATCYSVGVLRTA